MVGKCVHVYLLLFALVVQLINGFILVEGPRCYDCEAAFSPETCLKTKQCLRDQKCYTQKYKNSENVTAYRLGCQSEQVCKIATRSADADKCFNCCTGSACNINLCGKGDCPRGYYGQFCTDRCGHCAGNIQCDKATGACKNGCAEERLAPYCHALPETCFAPYYGPYCTDECGHCANDENCEKSEGRCMNGCKDGYVPPYCHTVCPKPWFGANCSSICGHCAGGEECEPHDGICVNGCEPGFIPPFCFEDIRVAGDDCSGIKHEHNFTVNGVYLLTKGDRTIEAWCDMSAETEGWIVFQRRENDSVLFNRTWDEYKIGFGNLSGSFWWGNDNLAAVTANSKYVLRVDLEDAAGKRYYAEYEDFRVDNEQAKYTLHVGRFSGNAADGLQYHNAAKFFTVDRDSTTGHYATDYHAGWWFRDSSSQPVNLNGIYNISPGVLGVNWYSTPSQSLRWTEMKFRSI